jgi:uncharacterized protein (TIGR02145 family)
MADESLSVLVSLRQSSIEGTIVYQEVHDVTSNAQGVVSLNVGDGEIENGTFESIPWSDGIFIQIDIKRGDDSQYSMLGVSQILSVPYALTAGNAIQGEGALGQTIIHDGTSWVPTDRISISDNTVEVLTEDGRDVEEPIFSVKNTNNEIVFAVYESGTRVYIAEPEAVKGTKGGFAVGGLSDQTKAEGPNYLTIFPDEVQFSIVQPVDEKSTKGGFAVGGLSDQTKEVTPNFFTMKPDSVRFQLTNNVLKGTRGGFAVGGLSDQTKSVEDYLMVNSDSTFVMNTLSAFGDVTIEGDMIYGGTVGTASVKDIDGNSYQTIKIGNQVWLKQNVRSTNGGSFNELTDYALYTGQSVDTMGYLYKFMPVTDPSGGLCPDGWHVPSWIDWEELFVTVGGYNWMGNTATIAARLMEASDLWVEPMITPTNQTSFSARPAGAADDVSDWNFFGIGQQSYFWSAYNSSGDPEVIVISAIDGVSIQPANELNGAYSVRCIKTVSVTK